MDDLMKDCVKVRNYQDAKGNKVTAGWLNWPSEYTNQALQEMAYKLVTNHSLAAKPPVAKTQEVKPSKAA